MSIVFQTVRDIIVTLVGIAGLFFGFYKYWKSREAQSVLRFDVSMEAFPSEAGKVVDVCLQIRNTGKAAAYVPVAKLNEAVCLVRKVQGEDKPMQLIWEQLEPLDDLGGLEYLGDEDWNQYYPDEPFVFEPGTYETYHVFFRTHYHGLLWVRAVIVDKDDYKWRADRLFTLR